MEDVTPSSPRGADNLAEKHKFTVDVPQIRLNGSRRGSTTAHNISKYPRTQTHAYTCAHVRTHGYLANGGPYITSAVPNNYDKHGVHVPGIIASATQEMRDRTVT